MQTVKSLPSLEQPLKMQKGMANKKKKKDSITYSNNQKDRNKKKTGRNKMDKQKLIKWQNYIQPHQ